MKNLDDFFYTPGGIPIRYDTIFKWQHPERFMLFYIPEKSLLALLIKDYLPFKDSLMVILRGQKQGSLPNLPAWEKLYSCNYIQLFFPIFLLSYLYKNQDSVSLDWIRSHLEAYFLSVWKKQPDDLQPFTDPDMRETKLVVEYEMALLLLKILCSLKAEDRNHKTFQNCVGVLYHSLFTHYPEQAKSLLDDSGTRWAVPEKIALFLENASFLESTTPWYIFIKNNFQTEPKDFQPIAKSLLQELGIVSFWILNTPSLTNDIQQEIGLFKEITYHILVEKESDKKVSDDEQMQLLTIAHQADLNQWTYREQILLLLSFYTALSRDTAFLRKTPDFATQYKLYLNALSLYMMIHLQDNLLDRIQRCFTTFSEQCRLASFYKIFPAHKTGHAFELPNFTLCETHHLPGLLGLCFKSPDILQNSAYIFLWSLCPYIPKRAFSNLTYQVEEAAFRKEVLFSLFSALPKVLEFCKQDLTQSEFHERYSALQARYQEIQPVFETMDDLRNVLLWEWDAFWADLVDYLRRTFFTFPETLSVQKQCDLVDRLCEQTLIPLRFPFATTLRSWPRLPILPRKTYSETPVPHPLREENLPPLLAFWIESVIVLQQAPYADYTAWVHAVYPWVKLGLEAQQLSGIVLDETKPIFLYTTLKEGKASEEVVQLTKSNVLSAFPYPKASFSFSAKVKESLFRTIKTLIVSMKANHRFDRLLDQVEALLKPPAAKPVKPNRTVPAIAPDKPSDPSLQDICQQKKRALKDIRSQLKTLQTLQEQITSLTSENSKLSSKDIPELQQSHQNILFSLSQEVEKIRKQNNLLETQLQDGLKP